ncbi:MAG: hypothetical protein GY929_27225, partial [Actinomycetia bacterium]|nr:hypothetical protein [Actinomycetes bacterium]
MRRTLFAILVSLMLVAAACGDSDNGDSADGDAAGGDTDTEASDTSAAEAGDNPDDTDPVDAAISDTPLVIARDMDLSTLDPARAFCDTCQLYLTAVYETLIGLDPADNSTFVPRLA